MLAISEETERFESEGADVDAWEERLEAALAKPARPNAEDTPSTHDAVCERIEQTRNFTRPCPQCRGSGSVQLSADTLARHERKIAKQRDPAARANLREKLRKQSSCAACSGSGAKGPPKRAKGVQRTICEDCGGGGGTLDGDACKTCRGAGDVCLGAADSMWSTVRCPRCRGSAEIEDEDEQDVCPLCKGDACTVPITCRSTGSTKHGPAPEFAAIEHDQAGASGSVHVSEPLDANDVAIDAHDAGVLDALDRLAVERPELAAALRAYRSPVGNKYDHGHPYGRTFVVWPLTESGRKLIGAAPAELRRELGAHPLELLAVIVDELERSEDPDDLRARLVTLANDEAGDLVTEARRVFAELASS